MIINVSDMIYDATGGTGGSAGQAASGPARFRRFNQRNGPNYGGRRCARRDVCVVGCDVSPHPHMDYSS
ncbi:hypothetical protein J6590_023416 [Homalodisca vitripennis]|nr:hypothetical protein J6590_023416 [Homalodisca vitripennis]